MPAIGRARRVQPWPLSDTDVGSMTAVRTGVPSSYDERWEPRRVPWPVIALPVAFVAVVVTWVGIDRQMWIDEYITFYVTTLSWSEFRLLLSNQDVVHGLYYLFMRLWVEVFGTSLVALRAPSMIGMAVAAGGLAVLGRRLVNTPVGLAAGLIFSVIPAVSRYGQEVRSYGLVTALAVLATLALLSALDRPTFLRWAGYTFLAIALTYMHFVAALVLLPHALLTLHAWRRSRDRRLAGWLYAAAATVAAAAPLLYVASTQAGQVSWIEANWQAVKEYPEHLFESPNLAWMLALLGIAGAFRLATLRSGIALPVVAWAVVPPLFCYVTFPVAHLFLAKYATFTLPAWALLAGAPLTAATGPTLARRPTTTYQGIAIALAVLVVAGAGLEGHRYVRTSPPFGEPDFQAAARVVDAGFQPRDGIVHGGELRKARVPFVYELQAAQPIDVFVSRSSADSGRFEPVECDEPAQCLGDVRRLWLVVTSEEGDAFAHLPADQAQLLRTRFTAKSTEKRKGVRVLLLVRKPSA